MKKTIFLPDRWVKFTLNEVLCIGITYTHCNSKKTELKTALVFYISNELETNCISFEFCENLTYLQFVKKTDEVKSQRDSNVDIDLLTPIERFVYSSISNKLKKDCSTAFTNHLYMN